MKSPRLATKLADLRAANSLTQEEVAAHLNVSKAAVSKWECGASAPDISLLPAIAELYAISLDDLFGRGGDMPKDQVDSAYLHALELLGSDREAGIAYVRGQARQHWSCLPLVRMMGLAAFAHVPASEGFDARPIEGDAARLADEAQRLFRRAMALDPHAGPLHPDVAPLAQLLQWTARFDEAKALVKPLVSEGPNLAALSLALLYQEEGQRDDALRILQRQVFTSLVEMQGALNALVPICDDAYLAEAERFAARLQATPEYASTSPTLLPVMRFEIAKRTAAAGRGAEALAALASFAEALATCCEILRRPVNAGLFDRIGDLVWDERGKDAQNEGEKAAANLQAAFANQLASDDAWDPLRDTGEFQKLVARLSEAAPHAKA